MNADDEIKARLVAKFVKKAFQGLLSDIPITQWYRYQPISHIPVSESEVSVTCHVTSCDCRDDEYPVYYYLVN